MDAGVEVVDGVAAWVAAATGEHGVVPGDAAARPIAWPLASLGGGAGAPRFHEKVAFVN